MEIQTSLIASQIDGGPLELESIGSGPAVVVVHGGGVDAPIYRRLAKKLGSAYRVHVYNRRGRGASAPRPDDYSLATEIGDLHSVLDSTGSVRVVGHSIGGFFALAAARELTIERLALFDPAVDVDGAFPTDYLPGFERLIDAGDTKAALLVMSQGLRNAGSDWPEGMQRAAINALLLIPQGKTMARLLHTVPAEANMALAADGPAANWASVRAPTRFYIGEKSPDYYLPVAHALAQAIPNASVELVPRLGHDALARAGTALVNSLRDFLA